MLCRWHAATAGPPVTCSFQGHRLQLPSSSAESPPHCLGTLPLSNAPAEMFAFLEATGSPLRNTTLVPDKRSACGLLVVQEACGLQRCEACLQRCLLPLESCRSRPPVEKGNTAPARVHTLPDV